jgi:RimJ/RimL family protein N-acetyltransferase
MIKLLPYDKTHLDLLVLSDEDKARYGDVSQFMQNPLADHGICFTAVADGRVLVVGGILMVTLHTGYGWTILSKYAPSYGLAVFRTVKRQLETMMRDLKLHRIETANLADAIEHHRWCELLGFRQEGILWQYDDEKRDYLRFAKLMEV